MSNLGEVSIPASSDYQDVETLLNESFVASTTYTLQATGDIKVCEATTKPTEGGFVVPAGKVFQFTYSSDGLWVKKLIKDAVVKLNVAD